MTGFLCYVWDSLAKEEFVENVAETSYGNLVTTYQPLVTGKGQIYFIKKLLEELED